jgi:hypothetical protein
MKKIFLKVVLSLLIVSNGYTSVMPVTEIEAGRENRTESGNREIPLSSSRGISDMSTSYQDDIEVFKQLNYKKIKELQLLTVLPPKKIDTGDIVRALIAVGIMGLSGFIGREVGAIVVNKYNTNDSLKPEAWIKMSLTLGICIAGGILAILWKDKWKDKWKGKETDVLNSKIRRYNQLVTDLKKTHNIQ